MAEPVYDVVIPTVGRPSLWALLERMADWGEPRPGHIWIVEDRLSGARPVRPPDHPTWLAERVWVLRGPTRGPAAARNAGWRASRAPWVVFLDDDVLPSSDWPSALAGDLGSVGPEVAGSQGGVRVPLQRHRRPTDWERNVAGLEGARWATADMAYRRAILEAVGGFDERFPRAYREDADLALRILRAGHRLARGSREVLHPVGPAGPWTSLRLQAGNTDDALMAALHGRGWGEAVGAPRGRRPVHLATTVLAAAAGAAWAAGRRKPAVAAGCAWLCATVELAWRRIRPGPRTPREVLRMVLTSAAMPPVATAYWLSGMARARWLTGRDRGVAFLAERGDPSTGPERRVA